MPPVATLEAVLTLQKQAYEQGLKEAQQATRQAGQQIAQASTQISKGADTASSGWSKMGSAVAAAARGAGQAASAVAKTAGLAIGAMGVAATGFGVSAFQAAARVGEMDTALAQLGKTAGIEKAAIDASVKSIKDKGITTQAAQNLTAQFIRGNLDLAKATDLARVAQDAAIYTQQDSSQVLQELLHGIQTGNTQLDVFEKLNIRAGQSIDAYAQSIGKTAGDLTQAERQQALLNAVLEAGIPIAGSYEAAMQEPGKVLRSFPRLFDDIKVSVGGVLVDAFGPLILKGYDLVKSFSGAVQEGGALRPVIEAIGNFAKQAAEPIGSLMEKLSGFLKGLKPGDVSGFASALQGLLPMLTSVGGGLAAFAGTGMLKNIPVLGQMLGGLNPIVAGLAVGIGGLLLTDKDMQGMFGDLLSAVKPVIPVLLDLGKNVLAQLMPAFKDLLAAVMPLIPVLIQTLLPVFTQLIEAIAPLLPMILELAAELISQLMPVFMQLVEAIAPILPVIAELAAELIQKLLPVFMQLVEAIAPLLPILAEMAAQLIEDLLPAVMPLIEAVAELAGQLFEVLGPVLKELFEAFKPLIPPITEIVKVLVSALVPTIKILSAVLVPIIELLATLFIAYVKNIAIPIITTVIGWFMKWADIVKTVYEAVADFVTGMIDFFQNFGDRMGEIWQAIYDNTIGWIVNMAQQAWQWIKGMVDKIVGFFQGLWKALVGGSIIPDLINGIVGLFTWLKEQTIDRVVSLVTGALSWFGSLKDKAISTVTSLWDTVKGLFGGARDWVVSTLQGMADKVSGVFNGMRDAVNGAMKTMANWIVDRLNDALHVVKNFLKLVNDSPLGKLGVHFDVAGMKDIPHFAQGGVVPGRGFGDTVPAMLTPGEVVLSRQAVRLLGGAERANRLNRGKGAGPGGDLGALVGQVAGQCLAWVSKFVPKFLGIPAAKDLAPLINASSPQPGFVFVQTFAPYGHTGFVTGTGNPVPVIDSNWGLDERIQTHTIPASQIAGYINVDGVGGIGTGGAQGIGDLVGGLIEKALGFADNLGEFAGPIAKGIVNQARQGLVDLAGKLGEVAGNAWDAASTALSNAIGRATPAQLHGWMDQANFHPAGGYPWADFIVGKESSWDLRAIGESWNGDAGSRGLWQIQPGAHPQYNLERLFEGLYNTKAAADIYRAQGPGAWSTNRLWTHDTGGDWPSNTWSWHGNTPTETVLTGPQSQKLTATLDLVAQRLGEEGERRPQQVTINIHTEGGDPDEIARRVSRVLAQQARFRS